MNHKDSYHEYVFCYNDQLPGTLTMLQKPERIPQLILQYPNDSMFMWVGVFENNQHIRAINLVQSQLGVFVFLKQNVEQVHKDILENRTTNTLVIVCTPQMYKGLSRLKETYQQIHKIICFTNDKQFHSDQKIPSLIRDDTPKLIKWLTQLKNMPQSDKILPNFLFVSEISKGDIQISNQLLYSILAMVDQKIDEITSAKIVDQLAKVVSLLQEMHPKFKISQTKTQQFLQELRNNMDSVSAIKWYTRQSIVNKLVNNLLRVTRRSTEIFYLQPYFKVLFKAVSQLQKQQKIKNLVCYRGGIISEEQIKLFERNKNRIVQNLGFLSTSVSPTVAERFAENVIFKISVNQDKKQQNHNYGYANISNFSEYYEEGQILFNPLNSFKILVVTYSEDTKKHLVELQYYSHLNAEAEDELILIRHGKRIKEFSAQLEQFQGTVILEEIAVRGRQVYFQKLFSIAEDLRSTENKMNWRAISLIFLGQLNMEKGLFSEAIKFFKKGQEQYDFSQEKTQFFLNRIGFCYLKCKNYQEAENIFRESLQKGLKHSKENLGEVLLERGDLKGAEEIFSERLQAYSNEIQKDNVYYATILSKFANLMSTKGSLRQGLQLFTKSYNLKAQILGFSHPSTLIQLHNIANTHYNLGNVKLAKEIFIQCLNLQRNYLGQRSFDYHLTLRSLASLYSDQGQLKMAEKMLKFSINVQSKILGEQDPYVLTLLNNLASIYQREYKVKQAVMIYKFCLQKQRKILGQSHPDYIVTLDNLSILYCQVGDKKSSIQANCKSRKLWLKLGGQEHPSYLNSLNNRGIICKAFDQYKKSGKTYLSCLIKGSKLFGLDHDFTLKELARAISMEKKNSRVDNIATFAQVAKKSFKTILSKPSRQNQVIQLTGQLGGLYLIKGNWAKAACFYSHNLFKEAKRRQWERVLESLQTLMTLYLEMGDFQKFDSVSKCCQLIVQHKKKLKQRYGKIIGRTVRNILKKKSTAQTKTKLIKTFDKIMKESNKIQSPECYNHIKTEFCLKYYQKMVRILVNLNLSRRQLESKLFGKEKLKCWPVIKSKRKLLKLKQKLKKVNATYRKGERSQLLF